MRDTGTEMIIFPRQKSRKSWDNIVNSAYKVDRFRIRDFVQEQYYETVRL